MCFLFLGITASTFVPAALSAVGSFFGRERSNRSNLRESQRNRDFQERMRNTSWQAGVEDMRAAGLNPALAYSQGGAASPGGSTASVDSSMGEAVSSARESAMQAKQLRLLDAQISKTQQEGREARSSADIAAANERMRDARYGYYFNPNGTPKGALADLLRSEHAQSLASSARSVADAQYMQFTVPQQKAIADVFSRVGGSGKAAQMLIPLLSQFVRPR